MFLILVNIDLLRHLTCGDDNILSISNPYTGSRVLVHMPEVSVDMSM